MIRLECVFRTDTPNKQAMIEPKWPNGCGRPKQNSGEQTVSVCDGGESRMATRKNDDGTISFINADPPLSGFEFVRSEKDGKCTLIVRDVQHEYVFVEES